MEWIIYTLIRNKNCCKEQRANVFSKRQLKFSFLFKSSNGLQFVLARKQLSTQNTSLNCLMDICPTCSKSHYPAYYLNWLRFIKNRTHLKLEAHSQKHFHYQAPTTNYITTVEFLPWCNIMPGTRAELPQFAMLSIPSDDDMYIH